MLIADDGSTDDTVQAANGLIAGDDRFRVLALSPNRGMGRALIEGTAAARGRRVAWVMADLSDELAAIDKMMKKMDLGFDMVVASRAMPGGDYGDLDPLKSFLSHAYSFVARLCFRLPIHDCTNAFRAFDRARFASLGLSSDDFAISPEFSIRAARAGWRVSQVPAGYRNRTHGETKFRIAKMGWRYGRLLFSERLRGRPRTK